MPPWLWNGPAEGEIKYTHRICCKSLPGFFHAKWLTNSSNLWYYELAEIPGKFNYRWVYTASNYFYELLSKNMSLTSKELVSLYRQMYLVRRFEEAAAKAYTERKIGGFLHLYIGQEAVCAGALHATQQKDYIICSYRDHAHYLLRGGTANAAMAELFGKETGCSKGRGGSMHFFNAEQNFMGGWGIVGAHVPLATGYAFASKYRGDDAVTLCFLGDGAVNIGPFHEGMCLAAIWDLPMVIIIENNFYAMGTPMHRSIRSSEAAIRADGYPIERVTVEGVDIEVCHDAVKKAAEKARAESKPQVIEFQTYRYRGHSMADPAKYRTKEELKEWKEKDPLILCRAKIEERHPEELSNLEDIENEVKQEVEEAVSFADSSPFPDISTLADYTLIEQA